MEEWKIFNFDELSGDVSQPPNYSNHPKNNQKFPGLNPIILVTVEEDVVGFQGHHSPLNLGGSGSMEAPGVISDDGPGTTSMKSLFISISAFLPSSYNTPNISITSIIPRRSHRLNLK